MIKISKKSELRLRTKIDSVIVETLLDVGYERIRGRREIQNAIVKVVKDWLRAEGEKGEVDG